MNNVPHFVTRFRRQAGTPHALSAFAAILWSTLWLAVAIQNGNFWTLEQWSAGPFSELHSLLISLPLVAAFLLTSKQTSSLSFWLLASYCVLSIAISVYLLGSFSSLCCCLLTWLVFAGFSVLKPLGGTNTVAMDNAEDSASVGDRTKDVASLQNSTVANESETFDSTESNWETGLEEASSDSSLDFEEEDIEGNEDVEDSSDSWLQQWTLRHLPTEDSSQSHQVEWFARHEWKPDQSSIELHVLFQPPFVKTPELQVELVEGEARIKVADKQPHGVRLELKANKADHADPVLIWLTATGQLDETK